MLLGADREAHRGGPDRQEKNTSHPDQARREAIP
jgi:hypothetical protein